MGIKKFLIFIISSNPAIALTLILSHNSP